MTFKDIFVELPLSRKVRICALNEVICSKVGAKILLSMSNSFNSDDDDDDAVLIIEKGHGKSSILQN